MAETEDDPNSADAGALSRRDFLATASASALALGLAPPASAAPSADAIANLSAVEAIAAMGRGELTAEQYATVLLDRCARATFLNAFITLQPQRVLAEAREADVQRAKGRPLGPLHGLPMPIKDSVNTAQYRTTAGTPALAEFHPAADAPIVATLRAAGAIVLGKTNLHELSYGWTSNNLAFGAVRNPYQHDRIPGGSSGGTAAAIAARLAPLGLAEDTEGSIRVPAALCGIIGFRPTTGRYSTAGAVPISALFDQVGPHARTMGDIALFDAVATGDSRPLQARPLAGVRLAISRRYWFAGLDPQVEHVAEQALRALKAAGAVLVEADVPGLQALIDRCTLQVQNHDVRVELPKFLATYAAGTTFDEVVARASSDIQSLFRHDVLPGGPGFVTEAAYHAAVTEHLPALRRTMQEYFARTGAAALVFPATMVTAPRIGDETELEVRGRRVRFDVAVARNIDPGSTAGLPGLVLPAGLAANGLPVALEFDGPAGSDRELLSLGLALEGVLGRLPAPPAL